MPGELFYSVLVAQGAAVVRQDFAAQAWTGPPTPNLGWWRSRVPDGNSNRPVWAPNDVLLDYFERLETEPQQWDVRYVLTLLLVRRRLLRAERTVTDARDHEQLVVYCARSEREHRVAVVMPDDARAREIQGQLTALLFGDPTARPLVSSEATGEPTAAAVEPAEVTAAEPATMETAASETELHEPVATETAAHEAVATEPAAHEAVAHETELLEPTAVDSVNTRSAA
ncbi:MAG: hypothetical protein ACKOBW_11530 [Planctomycetota bacterium]